MIECAFMMMTVAPILAQSSTMASAYIICLIIGGGLLFISTVFGGHSDADLDVDVGADLDMDVGADVDIDVDASADVDVDVDTGADVGHHVAVHHAAQGWAAVATWFSIRFVIYFAAAFGMVGTVLTHLSDYSPNVVAMAAILSGLVIGQGVHQMFRALQRSGRDSSPTRRDYVNKVARVTVAIHPPRRGEVALRVRRTERFVPAVAKNKKDRFDMGERVAVVAFKAGLAEVVSQKEFEFVTGSKVGENNDDDGNGGAA